MRFPIDLQITLGAGKSTVDVSALALTDFDLEMGVGDAEVDLSGSYGRDLDVTIRGGVGAATVLLPANVGVRAEVSGGLGSIEASGMTRQDGAYVNDAWGTSDTTIVLDIEGGVGEIELRVVE
jgi:predicted membrane protein